MENRREHERFTTSLSVEIIAGGDQVLAVSMNLSQGGVGVAMDRPLPAGTGVQLNLFLVEEGIEDERELPLALQGNVVWCKPRTEQDYIAGIRFLALSPAAQRRLQHFLGRLSAK
jgi:c-di-GMP-binding flagellar brake protein YcgR